MLERKRFWKGAILFAGTPLFKLISSKLQRVNRQHYSGNSGSTALTLFKRYIHTRSIILIAGFVWFESNNNCQTVYMHVIINLLQCLDRMMSILIHIAAVKSLPGLLIPGLLIPGLNR